MGTVLDYLKPAITESPVPSISDIIQQKTKEIWDRRDQELKNLLINHLGYMPSYSEVSAYASSIEYVDNRIDYYWEGEFIGSVSIKMPDIAINYQLPAHIHEIQISGTFSADR